MTGQQSILALLLLFWCSSAFAPGFAQSDNQSNLPAGFYVYLGPEPGKAAPKGFTVKWDGSILWQGSTGDPVFSTSVNGAGTVSGGSVHSNAAPATAASSTSAAKSIPAGYENCVTYNYPVIKWRPRPVASIPDAFAQLWTTYDWAPMGRGPARLKYKLTLLKAPSTVQRLEVQLLDHNGFKLAQFDASDFYTIPGTALMEARGDLPCAEDDYRLIRDYSVK